MMEIDADDVLVDSCYCDGREAVALGAIIQKESLEKDIQTQIEWCRISQTTGRSGLSS